MILELIDKNLMQEEAIIDDIAIRIQDEYMRAQITFNRFLRLIGITYEEIDMFRVKHSDSLYISPNGRYIMALRYSKNYDKRIVDDPRRGHFWWTLDKLKDSFQSTSGKCMNVFFVFCCHSYCSNNLDIELWQRCDEFLSVPVTVFERHNIDMINFRPHFYKDENGFEWRHDGKGIKEKFNRYLNIHRQLFMAFK